MNEHTVHTVAGTGGVRSPPQGQALGGGSLLQGIVWTSAAKWASQNLAWTSTLFVARLLTPEDDGPVGVVTQLGAEAAVP